MLCGEPSCARDRAGNQPFCESHREQMRRRGYTSPLRPILPRGVRVQCSGPECERHAVSKGMCPSHWRQARVGRALAPLKEQRRASERSDSCVIESCEGPDEIRGLCRRHNGQAHSFRIPAETFAQMINSAAGCQICGMDRPLTIDHDHSCCSGKKRTCGKCFRGLLCRQCNAAIGMANDDPKILERAIAYLHGA